MSTELKGACFVIMPITMPEPYLKLYKEDRDHFTHVLNHLFAPALSSAGFSMIPPKTAGSELIQAEVIKNLSTAELVLCDMSILNPNVFFEFGIRVALNKPVALVVDELTKPIPFDTSIINYLTYKSALDVWGIEKEREALVTHINTSLEKSRGFNSLWKYFGVATSGVFKAEDVTLADKIDLLIKEVAALRGEMTPRGDFFPEMSWLDLEKSKGAPSLWRRKALELLTTDAGSASAQYFQMRDALKRAAEPKKDDNGTQQPAGG